MGTEGFERDLLNHKKMGMHGRRFTAGKGNGVCGGGEVSQIRKMGKVPFPYPSPLEAKGRERWAWGHFSNEI